eukprot:Pompholyxophrys_sp_v1_NODE_25_length_3766_cov_6.615468.p1 type:complete len:432 gc:universal NODE_25_length_3766_cov_6.615468:1385-90(-)
MQTTFGMLTKLAALFMSNPFELIAKEDESKCIAKALETGNMHVSLVSCICANGYTMPPFFIFKAESEELIKSAPIGSDYYVTRKAYMTDEAWPYFIRHFFESLPPRSEDQHVLLILDGYGSHEANIELLEWLDDSKITLFALPAHTSHALQPLDVSVFGPLKTYIRVAFNQWLEDNPGKSFNRTLFCMLFNEAWDRAHSCENVISGFAKTGIWPFDAKLVEKIGSACSESLLNPSINSDPTVASMQEHLIKFPEDEARLESLKSSLSLSPRKLQVQETDLSRVAKILTYPMRCAKMTTKKKKTLSNSPLARIFNSPERIEQRRAEEERKKKEEEEKHVRAEERKRKREITLQVEEKRKKQKNDIETMETPIRDYLVSQNIIPSKNSILTIEVLKKGFQSNALFGKAPQKKGEMMAKMLDVLKAQSLTKNCL